MVINWSSILPGAVGGLVATSFSALFQGLLASRADRRRHLKERLDERRRLIIEFEERIAEALRGPMTADDRNRRLSQVNVFRERVDLAFGDAQLAARTAGAVLQFESLNAAQQTGRSAGESPGQQANECTAAMKRSAALLEKKVGL